MKTCLTGGIACGKSLLSHYLNELGVETIDADDVAHELIPDPAERRRIAAEVFVNPAKRTALEAKLHPQVKARIDEWFVAADGICAGGADVSPASPLSSSTRFQCSTLNSKLRIAVIPLLFEVHWDADYDIIACVVSSRANQIGRMTTMRGYTREEAEARLAAQMDLSEKAAKSHYVIRNDGSTDDLKAEAARFVGWLKERT